MGILTTRLLPGNYSTGAFHSILTPTEAQKYLETKCYICGLLFSCLNYVFSWFGFKGMEQIKSDDTTLILAENWKFHMFEAANVVCICLIQID